MPALVPPEITMDPQWQSQIEKDLRVIIFLKFHLLYSKTSFEI